MSAACLIKFNNITRSLLNCSRVQTKCITIRNYSGISRLQIAAAVITADKMLSLAAIAKRPLWQEEVGITQFSQFARVRRFSAKASMEENCIVPDVISVAPKETLSVQYGSDITVKPGIVLTPTQVKDQPCVKWEAAANSFYTLCMTDPDAPSRKDPQFREWHHWLVGNIPGNKVAEGEVLSAYVGSGPPKGTGLHRYVFLVYKQSGKLNFDEKRLPNNSGEGRGGFKIGKFAEKYKLGNPIAGNFYQAEYDDYVPLLYKQLGA